MLVDTNVLLRLVTGDIPAQAEEAAVRISAQKAGSVRMPDCVVAEMAFVLEFHKTYKWSRAAIAAALHDVFDIPQIAVSPIARDALGYFGRHAKLDFTDCLLAVQASRDKTDVLTFDKDLLRVLA